MPKHFSLPLIVTALCLCAVAAAQDEPTTRATSEAAAEKKLITVEMLYGPGERVNFSGSYARGMSWLDDGQSFLHRRGGKLQRVDAVTDEATPAYDYEALEATLKAHADFDDRATQRLSRRPGTFTADRSAVLIRHEQELYVYRFADETLTEFPVSEGQRRALAFSPQANYVSFVRDNNLYTASVSGKERRLTRDGTDTLLNGVLDWVYQEEVYGRGGWSAHWWRDDGAFIAYLQLDESEVPVYTIVNHADKHPDVEQTNYPKAGDPNPTVRLGVVRSTGGKTVWVDLSRYADIEFLIVRVSWAPDGKLIYQVQDRESRWLELNEADPKSGRSRTLLREISPAWVDILGDPRWLDDGSFLWRSDRDGYRHLYHYTREGRLIRRVTGGDWEVRRLYGVDEEDGWVYFSGTCDSPIESHAYRVKLAGGPVVRLTEPGFSHRTSFDPQFKYFIDSFSNVTTPTKVHLRQSDGSLVRVISENDVDVLDEYKLSTPEFVRVPASDGYMMNGMIIRPPDLEPGRKYPVWINTYAGPHAPSVRNSWGGTGLMLNHMLAQKGYIVYVCDPRSASGQGNVSAWQAYQRLGESELADIEDHIRWLARFDYVDTERVGIYGYSYGGFMAAYALTHSKMFKMGIAGAPVTDWNNYDTIYTERYMRTPQNNPDGYERTSVNRAGRNLHGRLLLVHGAMDDNVHVQSTLQLIHQFQAAQKVFDLMIYPRDRHGIGYGRRHFLNLRLEYIYEHL